MTENPTKHCGGCGKDLPRTPEFFYSKKAASIFKPSSRCKVCSIARTLDRYHNGPGVKARARIAMKRWARENADRLKEMNRKSWESRKAEVSRRIAEIRQSPAGRLRLNQVSRIGHLRRKYAVPRSVTPDLAIGCTWDEFVAHLERQFTDGMSWDNYGSWHIDHVIPVSSVDLTDHDACLMVLNFQNTRPLWGHENHKKGAKIISPSTDGGLHA